MFSVAGGEVEWFWKYFDKFLLLQKLRDQPCCWWALSNHQVRYWACSLQCSSLQSRGSRYQLLHGEFPRLALPVDDSREQQGRGEPEAGAEGQEGEEERSREVDCVDHHLFLWGLHTTNCPPVWAAERPGQGSQFCRSESHSHCTTLHWLVSRVSTNNKNKSPESYLSPAQPPPPPPPPPPASQEWRKAWRLRNWSSNTEEQGQVGEEEKAVGFLSLFALQHLGAQISHNSFIIIEY